jgi:broad specificity phosphatase PhoE
VLIYLRHGDDRGTDIYRHDRHLNDRGRQKAAKVAKRLIEKYGHPDTVHVSPFRRALETLDTMIEQFDRSVVVRCDRRLAQRLSEKQQRDPQVSPETLAQITVTEDEKAFHQRITEHVDEIRHATGIVWCVTHQAVIETIARHFKVKISGSLDYLDHVVMVG